MCIVPCVFTDWQRTLLPVNGAGLWQHKRTLCLHRLAENTTSSEQSYCRDCGNTSTPCVSTDWQRTLLPVNGARLWQHKRTLCLHRLAENTASSEQSYCRDCGNTSAPVSPQTGREHCSHWIELLPAATRTYLHLEWGSTSFSEIVKSLLGILFGCEFSAHTNYRN
jgi:hypothetical protein